MTEVEAALASGILKVAGNKLVSLLASEFAAVTGVKKDLSELQDIYDGIIPLLSAVRDRSLESDPQFHWVIKLKDVAHDVDDLLTEVHLEAEKHEIARGAEKYAIADCLVAKPRSFLYRCKVAHKIKAIKVTLAAIAKQRSNMNAIEHNVPPNQQSLSGNRSNVELSLLTNVEESQIPIRDQEKVRIISKLLESNDGEDDWIVSVVGLGGSGKTTLAKHICNDCKIKDQFKEKIYWVHVSQEFDVEKLIGKLFQAITKEKSDHYTPQHRVDEIYKKITGEKFLLILDDAWQEDKDDWKAFMVHLKSHAPGSKLMLTTRNRKVAETVKSWHIDLAFLSEAESWSFFLKSSGWTEEELGSDFIQVGKEIVNKGCGVPLATKVLGGILCQKKDISTWRAIRDSYLWNEGNKESRVFASLKLSYIHLNDHLKQCFTFCSIFPKGYIIFRTNLIGQWIIHGFIKHMKEEQPEVIGNEYFDSLVKIGFFQDLGESLPVKGVLYKMHDLIHDLTRCISQCDLISLQENVPADCTHKCRYLSLTSCSENVERGLFDKVRALYVSVGNPLVDKLVKRSRYICSVVLDYEIVCPFPLFITKLKYLGYLELRKVSCKKLPEAISGCWNLQSLQLFDCHGFATLPKSIGKLKKLRTLELIATDLENLPQSIGDCRDLRSLHMVYCSKLREIPNTIGRNENLRVLQIVECKKLQQLPSEFIGEFRNIETINLAGCCSLKDLPSTLSSRTLRTLNLSNTGVTKLPEWVTLMDTLECINLEDCRALVELPSDIGNLKRLEFLTLKGCRGLCWMPSGFAHLTRLKRLDLFLVGRDSCEGDHARISDLENLDMLSDDLDIRNLHHLIHSGDAQKACLKQKKNIRHLTLNWYLGLGCHTEEVVSDLGVLDALEPPSEIEKLRIYNYRGVHLPRFMSKQNDSSYLEGAVLKQISQPRFLCLIELELTLMANLKHMRGILVLPSLKNLRLISMPNLEELRTTTNGLGIWEDEEVGEQYCFPVLSELKIRKCPKLIVEPYLPPSLESLKLTGSSLFGLLRRRADEPTSSSRVLVVPQIKKLKLKEVTGSASDWGFLQHLARLDSLESLRFKYCDDLTELPESMRGLTSLQMLYINYCISFAALPGWLGELRSLQDLTLIACPISSLPRSIEHLTSLMTLTIDSCKNLKQLPDAIQHLSSLRALTLMYCWSLTVLPECIGQLSSLRILFIWHCPALQSLPSSIQRLTALQELYIVGCPDLARRCKKEVGDDWHLISHIPYVNIPDDS